MDLKHKIESRQAVVAIIGLGYVGRPLALAFADAGFHVIGIDADKTRVDAINRGESYVQDIPSDKLVRCTSRSIGSTPNAQGDSTLTATTDYDALSGADVAIICVPTPLSKTKDPDMSYVIAATDEIARHLHPGTLIVLESTTYPGTTEEVILPRLQHASGRQFKVGIDFLLAFSPERIDPGNREWNVRSTPKVIGGVTPHCLEVAGALYKCIVERIVPVSSARTAEMAKLLENTFRAVNIGLVNEVAIMCDHLGIDVWEVVEAAATKPFGFMAFQPGPGLGGHCIPIDPQYLAWKLRTLNYTARFIDLASEINLGMPRYVLGKIVDALNEDRKPLKGSRILVLGVTYKADVSDTRESPALDLISLLHERGAEVSYHDPYVSSLEVDYLAMAGVALDRERLQWADCVVITTAHSLYDWQWVVQNSRLVMDTRNATKGLNKAGARVIKL